MSKAAKALGWFASGLTFVWFGVHTFVGGAEVSGPLRLTDLPPVLLETLWMVWHMVTAVLLILAGLFALAVLRADRGMMWAAAAISAAIAAGGIGAAVVSGAGFGLLPQGLLFVPTALSGAVAARLMSRAAP